jgi:hypothetical protein
MDERTKGSIQGLGEGKRVDSNLTVTPAMIDAGVLAAREHCLGAPLSDLVTSIYLAMQLESDHSLDSASSTRALK